MKLGVLTVVYQDLTLEQALDKLAELGVETVELGTGNYPGNAHCNPEALLREPRRAKELRDAVAARGLEISALSCHGNPLHPDDAVSVPAHAVWEQTLKAAELLEVGVVNTFSGCPGDGPGARSPNWVTCAWPTEYLDVLDWQWNECALPYWSKQCDLVRAHGVSKIALEMHPGFLVYNPESLLRLRAGAGKEIGANFDPSHLFWQGIDPVAAIRALGSENAIFHAHAKDTYIDSGNARVNGVLDTKPYDHVRDRSWTFRTVGYGHGGGTWRDILGALRVAGYDYVLSIEHEDILASRDEGLAKAVEFLRPLMFSDPPAEAWWT